MRTGDDLLPFEIGQRLELRLANRVVRIAVKAAGEDLDICLAYRGENTEVTPALGNLGLAGNKRIDDKVRRHIGDTHIEIFLGEISLILRHQEIPFKSGEVSDAEVYTVSGQGQRDGYENQRKRPYELFCDVNHRSYPSYVVMS